MIDSITALVHPVDRELCANKIARSVLLANCEMDVIDLRYMLKNGDFSICSMVDSKEYELAKRLDPAWANSFSFALFDPFRIFIFRVRNGNGIVYWDSDSEGGVFSDPSSVEDLNVFFGQLDCDRVVVCAQEVFDDARGKVLTKLIGGIELPLNGARGDMQFVFESTGLFPVTGKYMCGSVVNRIERHFREGRV